MAAQPRAAGGGQQFGNRHRAGGGTWLSLPGWVPWAHPGPTSSHYCPRYSLGPRWQGWKGHTIPEAVTEHVHDLQERLDTQVPGEVIKLEQEKKEGFQMGAAKLQQL